MAKRTVADPASTTPEGSPPGAGKGSPLGRPSHRIRKSPGSFDRSGHADGNAFGPILQLPKAAWKVWPTKPPARSSATMPTATCRYPNASRSMLDPIEASP